VSIFGEASLAARLPHTTVAVADAVAAHSISELTNDPEIIAPTVSPFDPHFVIGRIGTDGRPGLECAFTSDDIERYYATKLGEAKNIGGEHRHAEIHGNWYGFLDTWATVRREADGELSEFRMAVLFPTWSDGIIGEIAWIEPGADDRYLDAGQFRNLTHQLNAYDDAWRRADVNARLATFEECVCGAIRVKRLDGQGDQRIIVQASDRLRDSWSAPAGGRVLEFERLAHVVSNFYAFGSYRVLLDVGDRTVVRETARLLPIGRSGRFVAELSYSFEADAAGFYRREAAPAGRLRPPDAGDVAPSMRSDRPA
jgi:hypothetical protein